MPDPTSPRRMSLRRVFGLTGSLLLVGSLLAPWVSVSSCECEGPATRTFVSVLRFLRSDQAILGVGWVRTTAILLVVAALSAAVLGALAAAGVVSSTGHRTVITLAVLTLALGVATLLGLLHIDPSRSQPLDTGALPFGIAMLAAGAGLLLLALGRGASAGQPASDRALDPSGASVLT